MGLVRNIILNRLFILDGLEFIFLQLAVILQARTISNYNTAASH